VGELLNEMVSEEGLIVRRTHIVQPNGIAAAVDAHRFMCTAVESAYHLVPSFAKTSLDLGSWLNQFNKKVRLSNDCCSI